jgi:nucleoid DNA-binding protein
MTLTKKDIVNKIAEDTGIKQIWVKKVVQKTFDSILDALVKGNRVELRDFGIFKVKARRARKGRNPRTGVAVPVPPKKAVVFKAGMEMKKKVA